MLSTILDVYTYLVFFLNHEWIGSFRGDSFAKFGENLTKETCTLGGINFRLVNL